MKEGELHVYRVTLICFAVAITAVLLLALYVGTHDHEVGSVVPCDDYIQITQKYKSLDSYGNTHYWFVLSDGTRVEMRSWSNSALNEAAWERARTNVTGRFFVDRYLGTGDTIFFQPQNITVSAEGVNFCQVIP